MTNLKDIKPGDKFFYKNVGYGLTSYERGDDAVAVRKGLLFTETFSSAGMEWNESKQTWVFDGGLGLRTFIVAGDDPKANAEVSA